MNDRKIVVRQAGRDEAHVVAQLATRTSDGARFGTRETSPVDEVGIAEAILSGSANFYVIYLGDDEPVGLVEWKWTGPRVSRAASVGVVIRDSKLWARGYGFQAVEEVMQELFYTQDAHRVEFMTSMSNYPMANLLARRGGPVIDGILRDYYYREGRHEDAVIWSVLRAEFDEVLGLVPEREERIRAHRDLVARTESRLADYIAKYGQTSVHLHQEHQCPVDEVGAL